MLAVSPPRFAAALLVGSVIRAVALPLPGTGDVGIWKIWSYNGALHGVTRLYGIGGSAFEGSTIDYHGSIAVVDYPPLALYEVTAVGTFYWRLHARRFPDTAALNAVMKIPTVLADVGTVWLVFWLVRRRIGTQAAQWAAIAYWLNPAVLLDGSILGYLDPLYVLPAMGSLVAATMGYAAVAGGLFAAAFLTKAQAIFMAPAVALAIWNTGTQPTSSRQMLSAAVAATLVAAAIVGPSVAAGGARNMIGGLASLAQHDMLSGNACNLWWLVGYWLRAYYSMHDMGIWAAFTAPTKILAISRVIEIGYPNPRPIGALLTLAAMTWGLWTARRVSSIWLLSACAAFLVHAYATLSAQVHENHLFAAVPFLIVAAIERRGFAPVCALVSAIVALNLYLFYGISEPLDYRIPRSLTIIDLTVVIAIVNCAALAWHAVVFRAECASTKTEGDFDVPR
jgi:hypothetical protein